MVEGVNRAGFNSKKDMSDTCGLGHEKAWGDGTIDEYFEKFCSKCKYMHEICMYGEEPGN